MNEWDSWKVGDVLMWVGNSSSERLTIIQVSANSVRAENAQGVPFQIFNQGPSNNPAYFWMLAPVSAPTRQWQVGDRVKHNQSGWLGYILDHRFGNLWRIRWDSGTEATYEENLLEYVENTCTTPAPVLCCTRCREYNEYAQANQPDGTYKCHQCRSDPWR